MEMKKTMPKPSFEEEILLWNKNIDFVIGIDEVGRGAFAGPIVAAGVIFHKDVEPKILCDINDSKLLKHNARKTCSEIIKKNALFWTIEEIGIDYINKFGIGKANSAVFRKVLKNLILKLDNRNYYILIDGFHKKFLPGGIKRQKGIVKGDQKSLTIASASILAKVHRDNLMRKANKIYPNYGFAKNKGYGTRDHRTAISNWGVTKYHRNAFIHSAETQPLLLEQAAKQVAQL
jgi:ribonuclease HII